jgi:hypothetical protein
MERAGRKNGVCKSAFLIDCNILHFPNHTFHSICGIGLYIFNLRRNSNSDVDVGVNEVTTLQRSFAAKSMHVISIQALIGNAVNRAVADTRYRGHTALPDYKFNVVTSGQKRGFILQVKREMKRRAAVDPMNGYLKA